MLPHVITYLKYSHLLTLEPNLQPIMPAAQMNLPAQRGWGTRHGRGGTRSTQPIPTANEGEYFNIVNVSDSDDSDGPCTTAVTPAPLIIRTESFDTHPPDSNDPSPAQPCGSLAAAPSGTSTDPLLETSKSLSKGCTHNIHFFFTRLLDHRAQCNFCR